MVVKMTIKKLQELQNMIDNLELAIIIIWYLLPFIIGVSIVTAIIWEIPTWIKQWKKLNEI
jgi:hypothetical protein